MSEQSLTGRFKRKLGNSQKKLQTEKEKTVMREGVVKNLSSICQLLRKGAP